MTDRFEGIPHPDVDALTVYAIGPGYGESQIVVLPGGRVMVVDAAVSDSTNLTRALLGHLDIETIDRLVLTHPDTDHVRGIAELIENVEVHFLWRYPAGTMVRELLATVLGVANRKLEDDQQKRRLQDLQDAYRRISEAAQNDMVVDDAVAGGSPWSPPDVEWAVHPIAPTPYDRQQAMRQWENIIELGPDAPATLTRRAVAALDSGYWSERPNLVSVGLAVCWGDVRILLAGDVEQQLTNERSGWQGVLRQVDRMLGRSDLASDPLVDITVVKVAHHGSDGAFVDAAWERHARTRRVPCAVIMPFDRHPAPLPHEGCLTRLRDRSAALVVTSQAGGSSTRVAAAGWSDADHPAVPAKAPVVAFRIDRAGRVSIHRGGPTSCWIR